MWVYPWPRLSRKVIGFDTDVDKVKKLSQSSHAQNLLLTNNDKEIGKADFIIICVPTPVTRSKEPDLSHIRSAAEIVGCSLTTRQIV